MPRRAPLRASEEILDQSRFVAARFAMNHRALVLEDSHLVDEDVLRLGLGDQSCHTRSFQDDADVVKGYFRYPAMRRDLRRSARPRTMLHVRRRSL